MREAFRYDRSQDGNNPDVGRGECAYRKITGTATGRLLCEPAGMLDPREYVLRFPQKNAARAGKRHVLAAALKQRHAHCRFELPNLLTQ
jgi:hypothetical protein